VSRLRERAELVIESPYKGMTAESATTPCVQQVKQQHWLGFLSAPALTGAGENYRAKKMPVNTVLRDFFSSCQEENDG
jgi:hypothetical protein